MDQPLLHAERVYEGFEHRAGRAPRVRAIDLSEDVVVEEVSRADEGAHAHVAGIDQHGGGVVHTQVPLGLDETADLPFEQSLQGQLQGGLHGATGGGLGQHLSGEVRGQKGQVVVSRRHPEGEKSSIPGRRPALEQATAESLTHAHELGRARTGAQSLHTQVRVLRQKGQGQRFG